MNECFPQTELQTNRPETHSAQIHGHCWLSSYCLMARTFPESSLSGDQLDSKICALESEKTRTQQTPAESFKLLKSMCQLDIHMHLFIFHDLTQNQTLEMECAVTPLRASFSNQYINICAKTDRRANNQHEALSDWRKQDKSGLSNTTTLTWHWWVLVPQTLADRLVWSSELLFKATEASAKCPVAMMLLVMTLKTVILRTCTPIQELLCFLIKL